VPIYVSKFGKVYLCNIFKKYIYLRKKLFVVNCMY